MPDDLYTDYLALRRSDEPPPPAPYGDGVRYYADGDGALRSLQSDGTDAAVGSGGGGSGVQVVTVPVSSAQILDLVNTDVVLIPGVPGSVIVVETVVYVYLAGATPYLDAGDNIAVVPSGQAFSWAGCPGVGFWDQSTDMFIEAAPGSNSAPYALSDLDGADVLLSDPTGATLGDGTLLVTVSYFLAPTA